MTRRRSKGGGGAGGAGGARRAAGSTGGRDFWGPPPTAAGSEGDDAAAAAAAAAERARRVRPTPDPGALPRSLGEPPLSVRGAAEKLGVVYAEAVRAAVALAGANGLLDLDD